MGPPLYMRSVIDWNVVRYAARTCIMFYNNTLYRMVQLIVPCLSINRNLRAIQEKRHLANSRNVNMV